ncbi:hypothetical protein GCM10022419_121860 [Nonomuraea rosea]|uniref:Uncharacterized protein n=1 Tax=Nonomuraea rosea TaxID=638574 RepID=A0ABP6ZQG1_9ACTN
MIGEQSRQIEGRVRAQCGQAMLLAGVGRRRVELVGQVAGAGGVQDAADGLGLELPSLRRAATLLIVYRDRVVSRDRPRGAMRALADPGLSEGPLVRRIRSFRSPLGRLERCAGAGSGSSDQQSSR